MYYDGSVTRNENETYKKIRIQVISQVYEFYFNVVCMKIFFYLLLPLQMYH